MLDRVLSRFTLGNLLTTHPPRDSLVKVRNPPFSRFLLCTTEC